MTKTTIMPFSDPSEISSDPLTDILRSGARGLIQQAVEAELAALLANHASETSEDGRARLVRHGFQAHDVRAEKMAQARRTNPPARNRSGD